MPLSQRTVWLPKTEHLHRAAFVRPSFLARNTVSWNVVELSGREYNSGSNRANDLKLRAGMKTLIYTCAHELIHIAKVQLVSLNIVRNIQCSMHFRNFFPFWLANICWVLIIGQVKSNNLDIKQSIKPQIRAVLLIKEPLLLEHFIIDTIAVIKCPFSKRKSQVNIIRSNRDKIVGRYTPETKFYLKENRRGKNEFLLKTLEISKFYTHFERETLALRTRMYFNLMRYCHGKFHLIKGWKYV